MVLYYLPTWFQAIKSVSAEKSGIMSLPLVLTVVVASVAAGGLVTALGYYAPFIIASSILMALGAGFLSTFQPDTAHPKWIGFQALFGIGVGIGMQQPLIAVQAVLPKKDHPIGTALMMFGQTFGASVFVSGTLVTLRSLIHTLLTKFCPLVAENVFNNRLIPAVRLVPGLDPRRVLETGATTLRANIPAQFLSSVLEAYNNAIANALYVSVAMAALSTLGSVFVHWTNIKGMNLG